MSLLKVNEVQNYNGSSLTLTASTVSTSAQLNTGGNISVTGSINVSDDSTTRSNLGLGSIATQAANSVDIDGGVIDGTTIGGTSAAAGTFTTFTSTGIDDNASSTALTIDSSGNVLVGTTTAGLSNSISTSIEASGLNNSRIFVNHSSGGSSNSSLFMGFGYGGNQIGSITQNSTTSTAFNTTSDYRLKENITEITDGITRVKQLNPSRFNFIADPNRTVDGFIAHEVQPIVPEAISGEKDAVDEDGSIVPQGIDQSKLVPLLTAALQEQQALIESQQSQIDALTARIEALETT